MTETTMKRDGLAELLHTGFVTGRLSDNTLQWIRDNNFVSHARTYVIAEGVRVFERERTAEEIHAAATKLRLVNEKAAAKSDTAPAAVNMDHLRMEHDQKRAMLYFSNCSMIKGHKVLRKGTKLIMKDIKKHILFSSSDKKQGRRSDKLYCQLDVEDAAVSFMIDGKKKQCGHTDYSTTAIRKLFDDAENNKTAAESMPLVLLLSLQRNTRLGYYPNSHKLITELQQDSIGDVQFFILAAGEFVIFHPLLVHFGCEYDINNTRVHFYINSDACKRQVDDDNEPMTFPVIVAHASSLASTLAREPTADTSRAAEAGAVAGAAETMAAAAAAGAAAAAEAGASETVAATPDPDFTVLTKAERASTARRGKRKQYNFDRVRAQSPDS
jgi:hypothetical protein